MPLTLSGLTYCSHNEFFPCRSKAVFNALEEEDIGIYACHVTHTDGASSSYSLSEEGRFQSLEDDRTQQEVKQMVISLSCLSSELKRLLEISHNHKFPSECFAIAAFFMYVTAGSLS